MIGGVNFSSGGCGCLKNSNRGSINGIHNFLLCFGVPFFFFAGRIIIFVRNYCLGYTVAWVFCYSMVG
jgi:hypothetical protein